MEVITELLSDNKNLALVLLSFLVSVFMRTILLNKEVYKIRPQNQLTHGKSADGSITIGRHQVKFGKNLVPGKKKNGFALLG
jgi:hypothetical protein